MFFLFSPADKVHKKAENINERRNANRDRALQQMEKLKDQLQLHQFLQVKETAQCICSENVDKNHMTTCNTHFTDTCGHSQTL